MLLNAFLAITCFASPPNEIVLVPIDSRPAAAQFPKMIADIGSISIASPPEESLGKFTTPGSPDSIGRWLLNHNYETCMAAVISADMLCYGGLIQSRVPAISVEVASQRLETLRSLRKSRPSLPIYVFCALMRTAPTATDAARSWRLDLARYMELLDKERQTGNVSRAELRALRKRIPDKQFEDYLAARKRNLDVMRKLIKLVEDGVISYLIVGGDDAKQYGPQNAEQDELRSLVNELNIAGLVYFCEGVDQDAILLCSRAALRTYSYTPRALVRLSNPDAASRRMAFEKKPLLDAVKDQIIVSGARPALSAEDADYTLYVHAPDTEPSQFDSFSESLAADLKEGRQAGLADIDFDPANGRQSMAEFLWKQPDVGLLASFAGWNTASNSTGTAIPHANMYLLAKRQNSDALHRELAHREFLFCRFVSDYGYHREVRPKAYHLVDALPGATREELSPEAFRIVENYVVRTTKSLMESYFKDLFLGRVFKADDAQYRISSLSNVEVTLPWPRVFETKIQFGFDAEKTTAQGRGR